MYDEKWIERIRDFLDKEIQEEDGVTVSIFNVPKPLLQSNPEAFVPQLIAIGPYHRRHPDLLEMDKYKNSIAKAFQKQLHPGVTFQQVVTSIMQSEYRIRANYHRHIEFHGEMLGWMMAIDGCFLLEYLQVYALEERGTPRYFRKFSSRVSHVVDGTGRKSGHNTVLRDIMMLENQIPLFVLENILDFKYPSPATGTVKEQFFHRILKGSMKEICPFKMIDDFPPITASGHSNHPHLLALLYYIIVPSKDDLPVVEDNSDDIYVNKPKMSGDIETGVRLEGETEHVQELCGIVCIMISKLGFVKHRITRPLVALVNIPWKLLGVIPGLSLIKKPVELFFSNFNPDDDSGSKSIENENTPPSADEIAIPSVKELIDAGVGFCRTNGDLSTISFDNSTGVFYLPTITLDVNSETILRNLVAYETSATSGPLVFTRYTELMNGIIDTEEDVRLLRKNLIIDNRMKNDKEVADVWNGMSRSVRLTKVPFLDKVIKDVNKYRDSQRKVRVKKFMKKYIFGSWPILTFLAAILLILLNGLQAICSVYSCSTWVDSIA